MQAPTSARRELDAEWPLQQRPQQLPPLHGSAAPLGQRSAGATAVASTLGSSPGGGAGDGALAAASASTQEAAERRGWSGPPLIPDSQPALAASRARHWPRWSHAPGGLAAGGANPDTRFVYPGEGSGDPGELALAGSGLRESAPLRRPGGAHRGGRQADPGTAGVGNPQSERAGPAGRAMPLPAEEGFHTEPPYPTRGGSSGGRSGGFGGSVPSTPERDAAHGASGRGQAGRRGADGAGWEGGSVRSADPQGASLGYLGDMGAGQEEAQEDQDLAAQGGPEAQGVARAVKPKSWLFGGRGSTAASAAVGTRGEMPEGRYSEVRGVAGAAYPQGGDFGYHGAAGSALGDNIAAGSDLEEDVARATEFPGRLSRRRSDRGGGRGQGSADELDLLNDDLPAEDANSAVQGLAAAAGFSGSASPDRRDSSSGERVWGGADELDSEYGDPVGEMADAEVQGRAAATGSFGRLARHRSDRADALEVSLLEPEAGTEDAEDAELAAGEADPEVKGLAMLGGASGRLPGLPALGTVTALGQGSANPMIADDSDLAAENDAEEADTEALYPVPAAQGVAQEGGGNFWRARTAADQGQAQEAAARRDPNPVTYPVTDFGGSDRGSSGAEQALADELQGRMNPGASHGLDPVGRPGSGVQGAHHTELAAANQRVAGVRRAREAVQADARVYNPSMVKTEGATAAPRAAWWGERSTAGSAAAQQPRVGSGAGVDGVSGSADPDSEGKASSKGAEHRETWAESVEHGADPGGLGVSSGARAPSAPAPDVDGAEADSLELGYLHGADPDGLGVSARARAPPGPALDVEGAGSGLLLDPPDATIPQDENSRRAPGPGWRWSRRVWVTCGSIELWEKCSSSSSWPWQVLIM